jgi:hypothetical protein
MSTSASAPLENNCYMANLADDKPMETAHPGACSGACEGQGEASQYFDHECHEGCKDYTISPETIKEAQDTARLNATFNCQKTGGPDCNCLGGKYAQVGEPICQNVIVEEPPGSKPKNKVQCLVTITYKYTGGTCGLDT